MTLPHPPEETPEERRAAERRRAQAGQALGRREKEIDNQRTRAALSMTTIGLTVAFSIGIGVGLGIWADRALKTGGIAVIIGSLLGIAAGFVQLFKLAFQAGKEQDRADAAERRLRRGPK